MDLLTYLKQEPRARERKNKNRAIGNLLSKKYRFDFLPKQMVADMVGEVLSLDRKWRKILEENPNLRGEDYDEKVILEQEAQIKLGYEPDYKNNVAKLKTL